jgi:hypothetical protein
MNLRKGIKVPEAEKPESMASVEFRMTDAITNVLTRGGKAFYDELTNEELFVYAKVLWGFHEDLRDEFSRREMHKAGYQWAAGMKR